MIPFFIFAWNLSVLGAMVYLVLHGHPGFAFLTLFLFGGSVKS